ncbi:MULTISPECIES: heme peroxidase family protein [Rhodomicrobium]|uniref:peroxidase family protein n=1 Tax=Rhodomicrobium TaxID=1068 RepID=UPI0014824473|nr:MULTISPECIES: heme peroxidase family protein [Rhodomicrobium]
MGDTHKFGFMFPNLQANSANRLPESDATVEALKVLGEAMVDANEPPPSGTVNDAGDGPIPAAYTYLGQFIDHDITFDKTGAPVNDLAVPNLRPRPDLEGLINTRSPTLELDSVYSDPAPRDPANPALMKIGKVQRINGSPPRTQPVPGKTDFNDVPRKPRNANELIDREALIGDPRNDENLIVAQLHLAFLKAHNKLATTKNLDFAGARRALRQRYQWMVLYDFLPRICNRHILNSLWETGSNWKVADEEQLFMPVEFAVAGYRFGHSMIRTVYDYNLNFPDARLSLLFTFTALSGQLGDFDTLPDNWIIQWERFVALNGSAPQKARAIDAQLTDFTFKLQDTFGKVEGSDPEVPGEVKRIAPKLAVRNLLRGYFLRLPTGQAVAKAMGMPVLEGAALLAALPTQKLKDAAEPFKSATPLWFYILAEAGDPKGANGQHLGPVGSRIVADTFYTLIKYSEDSILKPGTYLDFKSFTLADLIALASDDTV